MGCFVMKELFRMNFSDKDLMVISGRKWPDLPFMEGLNSLIAVMNSTLESYQIFIEGV